MKTDFSFTCKAIFYESEYDKKMCRKVLHLKKDGFYAKRQDLTIIMLNPGSAGYDEKISPKPIKTKLDRTLHKIKDEMAKCAKLNHVQVLNLFDIKNPKSQEFFAFLKEAKKSNPKIIERYSMFTEKRKKELYELIKPGEKVYLAWGTNKKKEDYLSTSDVMNILINELGAVILNTNQSKYYHPLARNEVVWFQYNKELL